MSCGSSFLPSFPFSKLDPKQNPLNLIIPGFEILWRAVLRTVIETRFKTGRHYPEWQKTIIAFTSQPTKDQFKGSHALSQISAENLVNEMLRLYPPTRCVHQQFPIDGCASRVVADLEACHRLADIWDPTQWSSIQEDERT
jgi:dihydroceramidase